MTGYRFRSLAEEEMSEAVFYDAAFLLVQEQTSSKIFIRPSILRGHIQKSERRWTSTSGERCVLIVSVAHHRRRPGYWTSRITADYS